MSLAHNQRQYNEWSGQEYMALMLAALAGGLIFGFLKPQSGDAFSLSLAIGRFAVSALATLALMWLQIWATKTAAVGMGIKATYDKYPLGLLLGVFISVLSFGYIPFLMTGRYDFKAIPNLRIGKFRGTMARNWELALASAAGPLACILITIPFNLLLFATGIEIIKHFIVVALLLAIYTMLPIPLIETANPYSVYMSRVEALKGNTPGYDIFFGIRPFFFFMFGMIVCFALLALLFEPTLFVLFLSFVLGIGAFFIYSKARLHFA